MELYQGNTEQAIDDQHDGPSDNSQNIDSEFRSTTDQPSIRQRHADVLVLMAERSLQVAGRDVEINLFETQCFFSPLTPPLAHQTQAHG